eukprot:TRINITY_DN435_c0_g2_i1.p1 TRINITY_DN435_c0_g2~~TRINITY_DN435_c0_g2_i1.p1  ORF type:complete len:2117 (-),score=606.84 TRINITY_DN435_c0_g2_i1:43-6393(-)
MAAAAPKELEAAAAALSAGAAFLLKGVLQPQPSLEKARRYFPVLRSWAETGKEYRGKVFSTADVEAAIAAYERSCANSSSSSAGPSSGQASSSASSAAPASGQPKSESQTKGGVEDYWPRWAVDAKRGVDILAPAGKGKPPAWTRATPVAIGYHGQKKRFLFVRTQHFEMDCRKNEVRPPNGSKTAQQQLEELLARGDSPERHPEWTNGSDVAVPSKYAAPKFITPGVAPRKKGSTESEEASGANSSLLEALEDDFERMQLLRRSKVVKTKTCDHPDPVAEPRAAASIRLPELTAQDTLALPAVVAEERLSSLQLETVCFAARRFRSTLPDGRAGGYVLGDGTGCGKGRVISALIYHMWNCGHRRSIWVSATSDLYYDACRDLQDLGAQIPCVPMRKLPPSGPLDKKGSEANKELVRNLGIEGDGVIFLTYSLLVQTGQRRDVFACTVQTREARQKLLGELLDAQLRCTAKAEFGSDSAGRPVQLRPGDKVVGVKNLRELQTMEVPFTVSFERVVGKDNKKPQEGEEKDGKEKDSKEKQASGDLTAWNSRLGQLVSWLGGSEATGLICFDEVHKAKNLVPDKDDKASTKTGLFVDLLQQHCPKAPVLYVSATAATEVQHLGYMARLGVWGPGTAFENFQDFMKTISSNGVAAMEMFAINMKAIGAMSCRALAYVGTEFETSQTGLTDEQIKQYNASAVFWQKVLQSFEKFVNSKELRDAYQQRFFKKLQKKEEEREREGKAKKKKDEDEDALGKRLWQFYWGAQQRFFKAICNSAKVPAACVAAQAAVDRGEQVVMSIWATGEARSRAKMERMKEECPGRVIVDSVSDGGLTELKVNQQATLKSVASCLYSNMRLRSNLTIGGKQVSQLSRLVEAGGKRINNLEELQKVSTPCTLIFRSASSSRLAVSAHTADSKEPVMFELMDDALGERVVVAKVVEGPAFFRRAELEGWHIKNINDKPCGKIQVAMMRQRLRKGVPVAFQDPVIEDHLSGPAMILEHFLKTCIITEDSSGDVIPWAAEIKEELLKDAEALTLPPNAMDAIMDNLGGLKKVAEMSGRSHRIKRRKDNSLAYVARCEELRCQADGANLVEQVLFQKGTKKICVVTEVASAGISLHADRRQVRENFQPPRRTLISVELPWGADKAIQVFGRVHRANQLVPPKFLVLTTPLGGEVRFTSAIARRMKLLGAVTKGDRMTSMGGVADRHMTEFDVNNAYGQRAIATFYTDTCKPESGMPELLALYEALPFIGEAGDGEATGIWPTWEDFAKDANRAWAVTHLHGELFILLDENKTRSWAEMGTKESEVINRFFNRILMLEVHLQNAMFDTFFAIYTELVRVDKANGVFDEGIENLNQAQGRTIRNIQAEHSEVLYRDPGSGAETRYLRLHLDRGISWEAAKEEFDAQTKQPGSVEGFYAFRRKPDSEPLYILVKETVQLGGAGSSGTTWISRRRKKQYCIWRADFGARTGISEGRKAYFEADFKDERYTRLSSSDEDMEQIREGWTKLYDESASTRLEKVHVLTGDVLTAWRLAYGTKSKKLGTKSDPEEKEEEDKDKDKNVPKLQIVRAITQPDNMPVVGMRLPEEDMPQMKYVLSCQQVAAQEKKPHVGVREATQQAADLLLQQLWNTKDQTLPIDSWLQAHKMLSELGVPKSVDGLRATQLAVEKLQRADLISLEEGKMVLSVCAGGRVVEKEADLLKPVEPPPTGEDLEYLLFPEEFADVEDIESDSLQLTDDDEDVVEVSRKSRSKVSDIPTPSKSSKTKEPKEAKEKPAKRGRGAKSKEEAQDGKTKGDKERSRKKRRRAADDGEEKEGITVPDHVMMQELFGDDDEEEEDDFQDSQDMEHRDAKKRQRDSEMAAALFGDFGEDSDEEGGDSQAHSDGPAATEASETITEEVLKKAVSTLLEGKDLTSISIKEMRASMERHLGLQEGGLDDRKDEVNRLLQAEVLRISSEEPAAKKSKASDSPASGPAAETAATEATEDSEATAGDAADIEKHEKKEKKEKKEKTNTHDAMEGADIQEEEKAEEKAPQKASQTWTYEVTGKKIAIRDTPNVGKEDPESEGVYLKTGMLFKVSEKIQGDDGRTYLRLADGRGWLYDRSAKDFDKVVVREVGAPSA